MAKCQKCSAPLSEAELEAYRRKCSKCLWSDRRRVPCASCGQPTGYIMGDSRAGSAPQCRSCHRRRPIKHGTPDGLKQHRRRGEDPCDPCREAWNAYTRERQAAARARGWVRGRRNKTFTGTCQFCGETFTAEQAQPFCSHSCHGRSRKRIRSTELVHVGPVVPPPHRLGVVPVVDLTPRKPRVWCAGPCVWCGESFTIIDQTTARYCSKQCTRQATKAKHGRRFLISPRRRLALYERDGWICQLCFEPIDRTAHYLDDWAPSLDHIEPQSFALIPDHSPENLRTAHRWCNAVRGDDSWHADLFEGVSARVPVRVRRDRRPSRDVAEPA